MQFRITDVSLQGTDYTSRLSVRFNRRWSWLSLFAVAFLTMFDDLSAEEITLQNDSVVAGSDVAVQLGFVAGERAASWLTSPCDGTIVAVQVLWQSANPLGLQSLEDSITIYSDTDTFPNPGVVLETIVGPIMTDGPLNEFRFLDQAMTNPVSVPVANGENFMVSFQFLNTPVAASVITDVDGCTAGRNSLFATPPGLWFDSCLLGLSGDFVIRAVVECGELPGACCEMGGACTDGVTATVCATGGGAFQGTGSDCGSLMCDEACCFSASSCLDLTVSDCVGASGFNAGPGTECASTTCFPTGACCNPDGSCTDDVSETDCTTTGGTYEGDAILCSGVSCPQPQAACCLSNGFCLFETEADCEVVQDSVWLGFGTDCADENMNSTADDCECTPSSQPQLAEVLDAGGSLVPMRTPRMIGIKTNSADAGRLQGIRVTAVGLAPPFDVWNGQSMWVGQPLEFSELPGRGVDSPGALGAENTFFSSELQCDPFFLDWSALSDRDLWIRGEFVVPSTLQPGGGGLSAESRYAIQFVDGVCPLGDEGNFSLSSEIVSAGWGDLAQLANGEDRAVNDTVAVEDTLFILQKFAGRGGVPGGLPLKARTDLLGLSTGPSPTLDLKITVNETVEVVAAFGGSGYPFVPSVTQFCP